MFNNLRFLLLAGAAVALSACMGTDPVTSKESHPKVSQDEAKTPHRRTSYLVDQTKVRNLTVRVDASIPVEGGADWYWATQEAVADWNNDGDISSLNFVYTTASTADITVLPASGVSDGPFLAEADVPTSGRNAGGVIWVDIWDSFWSSPYWDPWDKAATITHMLGHTIGLLHTNETQGTLIEDSYNGWEASTMATDILPPFSVTAEDRQAVSALYPNYERIGGAWWDQAIGITAHGSYLYIVHAAKLYRVDPSNGNYTQLGGAVWNQAVAITAHGSYLYIVHAAKLYRVDPSNGNYTQLGGTWWNQATAMTADASTLYILHASTIYKVSPSTGSYTAFGGASWSGTSTMTTMSGGYLALVHNGYYYKINTTSGTTYIMSPQVFTVSPKIAAIGAQIYIIENSALNVLAPNYGYIHGQDAIWSTVRGMTSLGNYLYIIQGSYLTKVHEMPYI